MGLFEPATAGYADNATDDGQCNYAMGSDAWQMVATPGETSPWRFDFGVDENDAYSLMVSMLTEIRLIQLRY